MRYEVFYKNHNLDGRALRIRRTIAHTLPDLVADLGIADVYLIDDQNPLPVDLAADLFADPVAQRCVQSEAVDHLDISGWTHIIEICYKPGVTDPVAITAKDAIAGALGKSTVDGSVVQTARQHIFTLSQAGENAAAEVASLLYNPLIERATIIDRQEWLRGERFPGVYSHSVQPSNVAVETIELSGATAGELESLSKDRLLALSTAEMEAVQRYFDLPDVAAARGAKGLPEGATDVELEMIAQTWSEHCKHKILNARVHYTEEGKTETIDSLFAVYIKGTTDDLAGRCAYLRSVFHDDSGVIAFDDETLVCFKVETHNSPSALDPYGGAITGIVGVNRDILGTGKGARPIFNTNVLCFGYPDTEARDVPQGLLHPRRVLSGVHHGIVDGGNQSGIPVVGGAFLFDESYSGKPLVFCGTGGILPATIGGEGAWIKHIDPGDHAVMVGGRIGKDGIHGATFSSLALDESSPTSAVQIGDPITQKKMSDFLQEARDRGLYKGITDNGAGGLSSSLGEMAESSNGISIDLEKCPLKYEGLAPWEILVSESQERMSLAVSPDTIDEFLLLAASRDVEATVVGGFTDTGLIEVFHDGKPVAMLSLEFLHDGLPTMELRAEWIPPDRPEPQFGSNIDDYTNDLLGLLSDPNIASKEDLIRQYDHEVQAQSVIKPFSGARQDAPSDGAVLRPRPDSVQGLTVTHGVCPRYGDVDTYHMAMCAVDEAFRAHVALGGDPEFASALDNFCWPDPVESESTPDGAYKMAQLVRACKGLREACMAYGLPLISGKDSMKNDAVLNGKKVSVRPTLLVSLMGVINDYTKAVNTDFKNAGDTIFLAGSTRGELGGSSYERLKGALMGGCPTVDPAEAVKLYTRLHTANSAGLVSSCHDVSDGGVAVALCESALAGRLGVRADLSSIGEAAVQAEAVRLLFSETPSRFIMSVDPANEKAFIESMAGLAIYRIGECTGGDEIDIAINGETTIHTNLEAVESAWKGWDLT